MLNMLLNILYLGLIIESINNVKEISKNISLLLRNIIPEVIYPNLCDKQKNILSILYQQHNKIICTRPIILAIIFIFTLQIFWSNYYKHYANFTLFHDLYHLQIWILTNWTIFISFHDRSEQLNTIWNNIHFIILGRIDCTNMKLYIKWIWIHQN